MPVPARPVRRLAVLALLAPGPLSGQGKWVPHQRPCNVSASHFLVRGGQLHLKIAIESRFPEQRAGRLQDARQVLHRAIEEAGQGENAGAWYYLGRTYAELQDFAGADSAFRRAVALAPDCAADVAGYTIPLSNQALNAARLAWDAGQRDSALRAFRLAQGLDPGNAEIPLFVSMLFAREQQPDSAARYLDLGRQAAGADSAHATRLRQASFDVARAYETRAYQQVPATQTVARTRADRDSTARRVTGDSTQLARILAEVGGIRAQGQRLSPRALEAFQRDSTALTTRLASARPARDSLAARAAADSAAAADALAPAIAQYTSLVERYPDDPDAPLVLLRLLSAAGDRAGLDAAVERVARSTHADQSVVGTAASLQEDGQSAAAARLLEAVLERNPNHHGALAVLTGVLHQAGQGQPVLDVARRRIALAPLDPNAFRAMAVGWNLLGQEDSTLRYLALADTGLGWHVLPAGLNLGEHSATLSGYVVNAAATPRPALQLEFEFLDASGSVLGTASADVPALEPRGRSRFSVRVEQGGVASWRYRVLGPPRGSG
ncbi:MAG TPA: FxLYD domain-containing protein [Gemmatimonadales bacterium]|nr:FxLYD domain-containing protein [Gemmatimonadales bacterium]